jgi:hypothetical protein
MNEALAEKQRKLSAFIDQNVYTCQSSLIDALLANQEVPEVEWEGIENLYPLFEKDGNVGTCGGCETEEVERNENDDCADCVGAQEIFEWWICSSWLVEKLRAMGEPILDTDYGTWWGRTTTGQAISLDYVIEKIYDELNK